MRATAQPATTWLCFSTAGIPEPERLERWEAHTSAIVTPMRCRTLQPYFNARQVRTATGGIDLFRTTGSPHIIERDARLTRAHPGDRVAVHVALRGNSVFYTGEGAWRLHPGQVLLQEDDQPFLRAYTGRMEDVAVAIPGSRYAELVRKARLTLPHIADIDGPSGAYVVALARLLDRATRSETAVKPGEQVILELVAALVTGERASLSVPAHFAAACEVIERNLADPGLGARFLAARIGISERHLSRVFAAHGMTVPEVVLSRRLDRAHRMLTGSNGDHLAVSEVARACGFASQSHFSNSFARRFSIRPSDLHRQARSAMAITG